MSRLRYWWPALAWACVIWIFSTEATGATQTSSFLIPLLRWIFPDASTATIWMYHGWIRKAGHVTEYFVFSLLLLRGVRAGRSGWQFGWGLATLGLAAAYAAFDEVHQAFVPGRGAAPADVLLDCLGAAAAQAWAWRRAVRAERKKSLAR